MALSFALHAERKRIIVMQTVVTKINYQNKMQLMFVVCASNETFSEARMSAGVKRNDNKAMENFLLSNGYF